MCDTFQIAPHLVFRRYQGLHLYLRARFYSSHKQAVAWRDVITQASKRRMVHGPGSRTATRYPWVEALFEDRFIQPFIHDTHITLVDNGQAHPLCTFLSKSYSPPPQ